MCLGFAEKLHEPTVRVKPKMSNKTIINAKTQSHKEKGKLNEMDCIPCVFASLRLILLFFDPLNSCIIQRSIPCHIHIVAIKISKPKKFSIFHLRIPENY